MNDTPHKTRLTTKEYEEIERVVAFRFPRKPSPSVPSAVVGFFGAGLFAFVTLVITGSDEFETQRGMVIMSIIGAICGFLYDKDFSKNARRRYWKQLVDDALIAKSRQADNAERNDGLI